MATYLQGVTDTGFNSVNTTPNLPYMMNALQKVTARYEKNYNDLSNQYSKITDSLLLNPENNEFRAKFLENSKDALKTLSTTDLSVQSNIDQAEQIFSPFWEDKDLLADYSKSKLYQQQVERHNALRSSDKKEDREQAWDMGLAYVQLTAKEMALAKRGDGSIQNIEVKPYVPYKNLNKELFEELKNLGFENGVITKAYAGNGYIKTITNGAGTKALYDDVLQKIFTNRPDLKEIFKVEGTVNFESTVFDEMKKNPSLSREEVEYNVKKGFATKQIANYDKQVYNINEQLDGTKEYKGLTRDIAETENSIYDRLKTKALTLDSQEAKSFFEKLNRRDELIRVKGLYEEKINSLKSNDFYGTKGEDYFADMFMNKFIDDSSSSREAAISEKYTSDSGYAAAQKLDATIDMFNAKMQQTEYKNSNNTGNNTGDGTNIGGIVTTDNDGNLIIEGIDKNKKVKTKERTESELLNIPKVGADYSSKAKDLEKSGYFNFIETISNYATGASDNAATYLNKSSLITDIPYMAEYINYLNHYANGGKKTTGVFKESEIKAAHKALLDKKIITISNYTSSPRTQIDQLVNHVDAESKNSDDLESVTARSNYINYSKYYIEGEKIKQEFEAQYIKNGPGGSLNKYVEKNKNNEFQFITAEGMIKQFNKVGKVFSNMYGINAKPTFPPASLLQQYYDGTIKGKEIKTVHKMEGDDPRSASSYGPVTYSYIIEDPKTNLKYDIKAFIKEYGTKENFDAKRKEYGENKGIEFSKYITTKAGLGGNDWIMSKTLRYENNPSDNVQDKSSDIAFAAIAENKGNVIEGSGGIIKPINFKKLTDDSYENEMTEVLGMLFNNQNALNGTLVNTYLKYQGTNNESSFVKLEFDKKKLQETLVIEDRGKEAIERLKKAISVLGDNGLEFDISKKIFKEFAKDNYMQTIVTDRLLKGNGLTATDYEKKNFYYDYKLTSGGGDKIILAYKTSSYNPTLKKFKESDWQYQEYTKNIGIDNILKEIRELGVRNGYSINKFLRNQTEQEKEKLELQEAEKQTKNAPYTQQPGESLEDWKKRIEREGKKRYKS